MNDLSRTADFTGTYLSTTIPFVNAPPHVGFALELAQADAVTRYLRLSGEPVWSSSGTDDHSLKNLRVAEAAGEPVRAFVARQAAAFVALALALDAEPDDRVSTSRDPRHAPGVERLFRACRANGDIYKRRFRGTYCLGCEAFYQPDELVAGVCPEHGVAPEIVEEENWFFRLSRFQGELLDAIQRDRIRVLPEERKNEVVAFVRRGLEDFSVSRDAERARGFGIGVPDDPSQVVYVWFDALANYLSVFDYGALGERSGFSRARRRVHVLGKGVLRFHAVYWPAILLSAGLALPDELRVHGYLTVDGKKIGKSLGNAIDPLALVEAYGATALRYYLLRHIPPFKDADFSRARLIEAHDRELADELGNLVRRVVTLVHRHAGGRCPEPAELGPTEHELDAGVRALPARLAAAFADHELAQGLNALWELVRAANRYVDAAAPWRLAREAATDPSARARLRSVLAAALGAIRAIAIGLSPFLPELARRVADAVAFRVEPGALAGLTLFAGADPVRALPEPAVLVPRIEQRERERRETG